MVFQVNLLIAIQAELVNAYTVGGSLFKNTCRNNFVVVFDLFGEGYIE
jgi:hypothetical protein